MILEDLKQLKTGPRELRKFGLLVGGVFAAIGLVMWLRHKPHFPWFLAPGLGLMAFGSVAPKALKPVYVAWMAMAFALGFVVSHVILTLFFFLVITPIGLVARLAGKDFLRLKSDPAAATYWIRREQREPKQPADYEKQF
jgi:hypothetical protein